MDRYNWNRSWGEQSMSLLCFAHIFCDKNKLTIREFCQQFSTASTKVGRRSGELIDPELSALDVSTHINRYYVSWERISGFYTNEYAVTHHKKEISRSLRYCPYCLSKGYHFSWQQLAWITHCQIHEAPLESHCECGKKIRYTLKQNPTRLGDLCDCGSLRFGRIQELSIQELNRLRWLRLGLSKLVRNFPKRLG